MLEDSFKKMEEAFKKLEKQAEDQNRFTPVVPSQERASRKLIWFIWGSPAHANKTYTFYVIDKAEREKILALALLGKERELIGYPFALAYAAGALSGLVTEVSPGLLVKVNTDARGMPAGAEIGWSELEEDERNMLRELFMKELRTAYESGKRTTWEKAALAFGVISVEEFLAEKGQSFGVLDELGEISF